MLVITEMQQLPIRTRRSEKNIPRWETENTIPDSEPYYRLKTKNMVPYCSNVLFYIKKQFIVKLRKKINWENAPLVPEEHMPWNWKLSNDIPSRVSQWPGFVER